MTQYKEVKIDLSENQLTNLRAAYNAKRELTIQISKESIRSGTSLMLTQTQINRLHRLEPSRSARIKISMTQMKKQNFDKIMKANESESEFSAMAESKPVQEAIDLSVTPEQIDQVPNNALVLSQLDNFDQFGEDIGALIMPFVKNVVPKVLGSLGLVAATGAISGSTHKATSGKGLKRAGGKIHLTVPDIEKIARLVVALQDSGIVNVYDKMVKQLGEQRGGFIGTLLAGLAGSLLPSLLGGKGLKRAGD